MLSKVKALLFGNREQDNMWPLQARSLKGGEHHWPAAVVLWTNGWFPVGAFLPGHSFGFPLNLGPRPEVWGCAGFQAETSAE